MSSLVTMLTAANVTTLRKSFRRGDFWLFALIFTLALGLVPMLVLAGLNLGFSLLAALLCVIAIAVLTVRWPVFGLFVTLLCAVTIEEGSITLVSDFTDRLYVFSWPPALEGLFDRPIGFLFLFILVVLIASRLAKREKPLSGGPLILPFGLFMLCVVFGVVHGLVSGGQLKIIVIEVRPLWYLFVNYLLAYNLIASRKHIRAFFWIVILGAAFKGLQGLYILLVAFHGSMQGHNELMAHEESFFFVALLLLIVLFSLHYHYRAQLIAALLALPPVLISLVANQRRADYIALVLGLAVAWVLVFAVRPQARRMLITVGLVILVLGGGYVAAFGHSDSTLASPARSIVAVFNPSDEDIRDAQSNLYRVAENHDLKYTEQQSPLIGVGFGKAFLTPWPLVDISADDPYYLFIPHNTIYWLWMRLGPIGYLLLWFVFGSIIVRGSLIVRKLKDTYLQMVGIYVVAVTFMEITVAFADYQLFFYRNVIYMGLLVGMLMKLPVIEQQEAVVPARQEQTVQISEAQQREKEVVA